MLIWWMIFHRQSLYFIGNLTSVNIFTNLLILRLADNEQSSWTIYKFNAGFDYQFYVFIIILQKNLNVLFDFINGK